MKLSQITKPVTAKSLNETLARRFGKKINVDTFTNEQLEDARNRLRTQLSNIETTESFDKVHSSNNYQKSKLFLDVINATIDERGTVIEGEVPAGLKAYQDKKNKGKAPAKKTAKGDNKKPDADGDGVPDWADKDSKTEGIKIIQGKNGAPNSAMGVAEPKGAQAAKPKGAQAAGGKGAMAAQPKGKGIGAAEPKKSKVREGAEEEATLVMAAKDMVDRITGWMEDTAEMQTESMLELGDKIRDEHGVDQSENFINTVKPALGSLFSSLEVTRDALTSGVAILTGEGAPQTMGDEVEDDDMTDMDMDDTDMDADVDADDMDDEFGAADASAGGDEPEDRSKRESVELSKRLGLLLAGSKKKQ